MGPYKTVNTVMKLNYIENPTNIFAPKEHKPEESELTENRQCLYFVICSVRYAIFANVFTRQGIC
jgi:hypothetical protein